MHKQTVLWAALATSDPLLNNKRLHYTPIQNLQLQLQQLNNKHLGE